jgi:hypothetical protein
MQPRYHQPTKTQSVVSRATKPLTFLEFAAAVALVLLLAALFLGYLYQPL